MSDNPSVLVASPIRFRPDNPEVLPAFLDAVAALDWPEDRREFWFAVQGYAEQMRLDLEKWLVPFRWAYYQIPAPEDSREIGGPRSSGETQENIALLRNKIFRRFMDSEADLCLMVDSDIVLAPEALAVMAQQLELHAAMSGDDIRDLKVTVTCQIDNRIGAEESPAGNAQVRNTRGGWSRAPWSDDCDVIEVHRAGACTLYTRAALCRRFYVDYRYPEEHQWLFDELTDLGFLHMLIRDPGLADHRMKRLIPKHRREAEA